jgi:hypothetical protein
MTANDDASASKGDTPAQQVGRAPSLFAPSLVKGVMIALILMTVSLFGGDVAGGALQVSMTLATLFALAVAWFE